MSKRAYENRAEWLADRQRTIGASEVASVLGANPYRGALGVYTNKVEGNQEPESRRMRAGLALEAGILELWAAENDAEIEPNGLTVWTDERSGYLSATPDALATVAGKPTLVEAKCCAPESLRTTWAGDEPPIMYQVQVQAQLAVLASNGREMDAGKLVAYFGGDTLLEFDIAPDPELWDLIRERCGQFWKNHVLAKVPPKIDAFATPEEVRRAWRRAAEGKEVEVDPSLALRWRDTKAALKIAQDAHDQADAEFRAAIEDGELVTCQGILVATYKNQVSNYKATEARTVESRVLRAKKGLESIA